MGAIVFYLFYGVNWLMTLLPLAVLYRISDLLFLLLYYFPSYRREVVSTNLRNAFPEKSEEERKSIEKKFYRHLADLFVETLKLTHISKKKLMKRCMISNPEILDKVHLEKRDAMAVLGHYNNWEWLVIVPEHTNYKFTTIYKPLQNKYFDRFLNSLRTQYGSLLVPMSFILREIINDRKKGINSFSAFVADQTPAKSEIRYWTKFLNQDTPVFTGAEKIALKYDMAVFFFNLQKVRRGHYNLIIEPLFDHTTGLPEHVITEKYIRRLEEIIREKPEYWLWSHRRWKHKKPVENE
jgi:KDO2-lipid IV(A) lauroyltransferase